MTKIVFGLALMLLSINNLMAKNITITADFTPSVTSPTNNKFTNTTPAYGYCAGTFANHCANNNWFSVGLGIDANAAEPIMSQDNVSFNIDSTNKDVVVTNRVTGAQKIVTFAMIGLGARNSGYGGSATGVNAQWLGGAASSWVNAPSGCSGTSHGVGDNNHYTWFWRWPNRNNTTVCTKRTSVDRGSFPNLNRVSFMYLLTTPNPLEMDDGVYEGQISYSVAGSGADINIGGPKYQAADDRLTINFELTVTHEMSVRPVDTGAVELHACQTGKICTAAENKINWEKATVTNIPPVLTAESHFEMTSSGSFTTYLSCESNVGEHCGLKSVKTGDVVPVKTLLTLPGNVQTGSGSAVRKMLMKNVKDTGYALFNTAQYEPGGKGKFHFEVDKQDVVQMRKNAPDEYTGVVTVIFDPQVW
ncbi:hypothetical protein ACLBW2_06840 [Enterobacteriaceae bacterium C23F]